MKFILVSFVVTVLLLVTLTNSQSAVPRLLGSIPLKQVAYVEVYEDQKDSNNTADRFTLFLSTFDAYNFARDSKYYMRSPGSQLDKVSEWKFTEIDEAKTSFWPNNPEYMPKEVAGAEGVVWTSGFLVPGKKQGALELYDTASNPPIGPFSISTQDTETWSYHRVHWKDMNGDGKLDALTCRFNVQLSGTVHTQLVWLENPGVPLADTPTNGWTQHILQDSASNTNGVEALDVHFRNFQHTATNGETYDCIIAAEFFHEELGLYYTSVSNGFTNWTQVTRVPIDTSLGQVFEVYIDDYNRDGRMEILATAYNHSIGSVFVFQIPQDFPNDLNFVKTTIADGFIANGIIGGQSMTPGTPQPFHPTKAHEEEQKKPYILLSGDDDGRHYILEPNSEEPTDWTYTKHVLVDTERTTSGTHSVMDLDGDGYTEIIAAGYTIGQLYVFTYKPEA